MLRDLEQSRTYRSKRFHQTSQKPKIFSQSFIGAKMFSLPLFGRSMILYLFFHNTLYNVYSLNVTNVSLLTIHYIVMNAYAFRETLNLLNKIVGKKQLYRYTTSCVLHQMVYPASDAARRVTA